MPRTAVTGPYRQPINNLVRNSDFEYAPTFTAATNTAGRWIDGTAGGSLTNDIYGWGFQINSGTGASVQYDTAVYRSGVGSIKMSVTGAAVNSYVSQTRFISASNVIRYGIRVLPSTSYTGTYWVKTIKNSGTTGTGANVRFSEYDGTGTAGPQNLTTAVAVTQDWTQYTITFTTDAATRFIAPQLYVIGTDLSMDAWFDDIRLDLTTGTTRTAITGPFRQPVDNMVRNADFEYAPAFTAGTNTANRWIDGTAAGSSASDSPYNWCVPSGKSGTADAQYDTSEKRNGTASMKLTIAANSVIAASQAFGAAATILRKAIPVLPSTSYTMTGWIKTAWISGTSTRGAYIRVEQFNGAGGSITSTDTSYTSGNNIDWTQYKTTITTNSACAFVVVTCNAHSTAGTTTLNGSAWFDDIRLDLTTSSSRLVS